MKTLDNVTLEMSLKPFSDPGDAAVRCVVERMIRQWEPIHRCARQISVLLWVGDGSEILDYAGNLDGSFEWGSFIGMANPYMNFPGDPEGRCPHSRGTRYVSDPPVLTYRWLQRLAEIVREIAGAGGKPVRVGATFDPGPEFARSSFKYERHREICGEMWHGTFIRCDARLASDSRRYAGFPEGIPKGTSLGTFLGRQARLFTEDLGFDYLWLSNGFGFGAETWTARGTIFDGVRFDHASIPDIRECLLGFWRDFRTECPALPVEVRGTNQSTGIDLASDATPLADIYGGGFITQPPPNSPWAAINGDFGLELAGWMSHIAELPGESYPFRFYTHDPWWLNSPWLDRYGHCPHDIYLPLSVARIGGDGVVHGPGSIAFLTVDDSRGRMPDEVPEEVLPHVKEALRAAPDAPGPLVWVYPFADYHEMTFGPRPRLEEVFFGDRFVRRAINSGLPLNTVVSSANLVRIRRDNTSFLRDVVWVLPVPASASPIAEALWSHLSMGGRAIIYGPMIHADARLLTALGLKTAEPVEGECVIEVSAGPLERELKEVEPAFVHASVLSGGGLCEVAAGDPDGRDILAVVKDRRGSERLAAVFVAEEAWGGGALAWVRGSEEPDASVHDPEHRVDARGDAGFPTSALMRAVLARMGCEIAFAKSSRDRIPPVLTVSRFRNGFCFSGYSPDTRVELRFRFSQGAPLLEDVEAVFIEGRSCYQLPRAWRHRCRLFVSQAHGQMSAKEVHTGIPGVHGRLHVRGLRSAVLTFYPDPDWQDSVEMLLDPVYPYFEGTFVEYRHERVHGDPVLVTGELTGDLMISW